MNSILVICALLGCAGHVCGVHSELALLEVRDVDFENTKVEKTCLIAELNATVVIYHNVNNVRTVFSEIVVPQHVSTTGSFCNVNYVSELRIGFHHNEVTLVFIRESVSLSVPKKTTYCDHCDYGTWEISEMSIKVNAGEFIIHASISDDLRHYAHELTDGIELKRSFKCEENDRVIVAPLVIDGVSNSTSGDEVDSHVWDADIKFYSIQVQPFLVLTKHFNDPYLCRDVTISHALVITLPIVYFIIFILFYRVKSEYGCPPRWNSETKPKKLSVDVEESTNMMSEEFSTIQLGLTSSSAQY